MPSKGTMFKFVSKKDAPPAMQGGAVQKNAYQARLERLNEGTKMSKSQRAKPVKGAKGKKKSRRAKKLKVS